MIYALIPFSDTIYVEQPDISSSSNITYISDPEPAHIIHKSSHNISWVDIVLSILVIVSFITMLLCIVVGKCDCCCSFDNSCCHLNNSCSSLDNNCILNNCEYCGCIEIFKQDIEADTYIQFNDDDFSDSDDTSK